MLRKGGGPATRQRVTVRNSYARACFSHVSPELAAWELHSRTPPSNRGAEGDDGSTKSGGVALWARVARVAHVVRAAGFGSFMIAARMRKKSGGAIERLREEVGDVDK